MNSSNTQETHPSPWKVVAASVTGTSHIKVDQPCQDRHFYRIAPNGFLIAAVADGAGSAALSAVGAQIAAERVVDALETRTSNLATAPIDTNWRTIMKESLTAARTAVEDEAVARGVTSRDLATTLIAVVASPDFAVLGQIGDGAAVVNTPEMLLPLTPTSEEGGDTYVNQTVFLTSPNSMEWLQVKYRQGPVVFVAAFSDGLQRLALKMPEGKPHAPFFAPLFQFAAGAGSDASEQLSAFLRSPRISERTDDDLTFVIAIPQTNNR